MKVLVAVDSESGNTMEMAAEVCSALRKAGCEVVLHRINGRQPFQELPGLDLVFIGTYTWGYGEPPPATEWFMAENGFSCPVACFGSGETQWGEEYFCGAVDRLVSHYASSFPGFKQEQMPNSRQRAQIRDWTVQILNRVQDSTEPTQELTHMADTVVFEEFRPEALQGEWLVEFYKDNCVPCKMLGKTLDRFQSDTNVLKVFLSGDADFENAAADYSVRSVPTLLLVRDGELLHQTAGFKSPAELSSLLSTHFESAKVAA